MFFLADTASIIDRVHWKFLGKREMDSVQEAVIQRSSVIREGSLRDDDRKGKRERKEEFPRWARIVNYDDCLGTVRVESVISRLLSLSKSLGDNLKRLIARLNIRFSGSLNYYCWLPRVSLEVTSIFLCVLDF